MFCVIVENEAEFDRAVQAATEKTLRIACVSNAGLTGSRKRLTFLPEDAFLKPGEVQKPSPEPRDVREWLADIAGNLDD